MRFDTLKDWDLGWALLEPIRTAKDEKEELSLATRLSPGQKSLYFFWYLDDEVTNGGFIQFFWNDYEKYVPAITNGLNLIGDTVITSLVFQAAEEYHKHILEFHQQKLKDDWSPLYDNLKEFDSLDSLYYKKRQNAMELLEKYIRGNSDEFAKFK